MRFSSFKSILFLSALLFISFSVFSMEGYSYEKNEILEDAVFKNINNYGSEILKYSDEFGLDPALIVAVLYIEKMQYELDIFRKTKKILENTLNDYIVFSDNLFSWAQLSIGFTHIKPFFARETKRRLDKKPEYIGYLSEEDVSPSFYSNSPEAAIKITAASFNIFIDQWKNDPGGVDISNNPGVLATLYNIGYEKSIPNKNPVAGGSYLPVIIDSKLIENLSFGNKVEILIFESIKMQSFLANLR